MPARRVEITVSEETWNLIERARGATPRATWIKDAIDARLPTPEQAENPPTAEQLSTMLGEAVSHLQSVMSSLNELADTGTGTVG